MITLTDLLKVLDVHAVTVEAELTAHLTSRVRFNPNDLAALDDVVCLYGDMEVKSIECDCDINCATVTVARP